MRPTLLVALALLSACTTAPLTKPAAIARPALPPHFEEVAYGLVACERGYVLQSHACVPDAAVAHGPTFEVSKLPSAGEGAPGTCPSGGCRSAAPRIFYAPRTYTTPSGWTYVPSDGYHPGELVRSTAPMSTTRIMLPPPW